MKKYYLSEAEIDAAVQQQVVGKLLRTGWLGKAQLVLTTYETLRDLEFSLAQQPWSVMICDEAQKIKNPNAMVSRSAKKQNARFKVACTGTPVENSLADLWCLFDYMQPGLLGALNEFGQRYRKPIEAKTDEEQKKVEELRELIQPQLLRRMKSDVAKDLPAKHEKPHRLPLSSQQRNFYAQIIGTFKAKQNEATAHLGLLHELRKVCANPVAAGYQAAAQNVAEILPQSPKLSWLVRQLGDIQKQQEKTIIFCEFKDMQLLIQKTIREHFSYHAKIVNGDTSTASNSANNRQRVIDAFQAAAGFGVIILSPVAVGFGVNIQKANHVIHFTRTWNPAKEDQATDRAYRIGQEKEVYVHYPIVVADDFVTFDDKLDQLLAAKRCLAGDMLNGMGDINWGEFTDLGSPSGDVIFSDRPLRKQDVNTMKGLTFEKFCALLWSKQGYLTYKTPDSGDGGVDVVAIREHKGWLIQCKHTTGKQNLSWDAVKEVVGGAQAYRTKYPKVNFELAVVTNHEWNNTARQQAVQNQVNLWNGNTLDELLQCYPVSVFEFDKFVSRE